MPAFPRRYSVATSVASYENATTHGGSSYLAASHGGCSSASPTLQQTNPNSAHSNTVLLLTPPIDFKSGASSPSSPMADVPIELKRRSASLSQDDILAYIHKLERQEATKQRSPSVDHIPPTTGSSQPIFLSKVQSPTDPRSVSSSAGTFYDCISTCSVDNTRDPQTLTNEINRMCALLVAHSDIDRKIPETIGNRIGNEYLAADLPCFISKTPSPHSDNYLRHYQLYMSKSQDDAREATFASGSGSELTEIDTSSSGQIFPSNSRKKKNSIKEASSASEMIQQSKWYAGHPIDSVDFFENYGGHRFPEQVTTIPLPLLEMTRYLLVEVSHFISPSLFYLIVNDEKCGSNAFEDFLESFQNFYKSLEYLLEEEQQYNQNGFSEDPEETESDSEWKLYFTSAPMPESVVLGSYWAGYLDEAYEWRRVQVTQLVDASGSSERTITARDVDSGFSTRIYISSLRPLREEFGSIPAFAIRASLAYLYPRPYRSASTGSLQPEDTLSVWPEECCRLFETLTFDQILTASIIEIQREDLTDTEIAQVLLWCSPSSGGNQEDEICINRKLIELNFAANVAEDDQWLLRSTESMNCPSSKSSQIINPAEEQEVPFEASTEIVSPVANTPEMPSTKKKKLKKVLSKKKKESSSLMVDLEAVNTSITQVPTAEINCDPNVLLGEPSETTRKYICPFDAPTHSTDHLPASTSMLTTANEHTDSSKSFTKSNELFYFTVTFALIYMYFSYLINAL